MFQKYLRPLAIAFISVVGLWVGNSAFRYLTYDVAPVVEVVGVDQGKNYNGKIKCLLRSKNDYKIDSVSLFIDGRALEVVGAESVRSKNFTLPFEIETSGLDNGKHLLKIKSVDSSYHANKSKDAIEFNIDNTPLKAAFLQPDYTVSQGHTLHAKIKLNKRVDNAKITLFSQTYDCYPESDNSTIYEAFIPIDCEQFPEDYLIAFDVTDKVGNKAKLSSSVKIKNIIFPKQKGFSVSREKLDDEKEVSMNNKILSQALEKWVIDSPRKKLWRGKFESPTVVKRLSTPFGEIRITPEKGRYLHRAVDIVNTPQSVVWASQNGNVIIKDRYLMTGNTVVIDHGLGVFTKYFHLDDFSDIEVGDFIRKGSPVGRLGMTGYANGYHLHWELSVNNVSVEPFEWTKKIF